jgi:hypothetical protein
MDAYNNLRFRPDSPELVVGLCLSKREVSWVSDTETLRRMRGHRWRFILHLSAHFCADRIECIYAAPDYYLHPFIPS